MTQCKTASDCNNLLGLTGTYECEKRHVYVNNNNGKYVDYNSCTKINSVDCTEGKEVVDKVFTCIAGGILIVIAIILLIWYICMFVRIIYFR